MKRTNIPIYIDLLFCLVIMPPIIMLVPVDRWIVHHTVFMLTLIVYLYGLYFVYRKARLPRLFMQRKFGHILLLMGILVVITLLLTQFPYPPEPNKLDPLIHKPQQATVARHNTTPEKQTLSPVYNGRAGFPS